MNSEEIIPENKTGKKTDIESQEELASIDEAKQFFIACKQRLLDINNWTKIAGKGGADFTLTDANGKKVERDTAAVGDHFMIDIPGPGSKTGEGYDWVRIEKIDETSDAENDSELVAIRVRPTGNPNNDKQDVAHFFTDEATSSFIVERHQKTVTAGVHGRNEVPNTKAEEALDKTRNTFVALGAIAGFSNIQWKSLVNGLLGK